VLIDTSVVGPQRTELESNNGSVFANKVDYLILGPNATSVGSNEKESAKQKQSNATIKRPQQARRQPR
jgi:hypothetical protein